MTAPTGVGALGGGLVNGVGVGLVVHGGLVAVQGVWGWVESVGHVLKMATGGGSGGKKYTFPDEKELARRLGIRLDQIHEVKNAILRDKEIKQSLNKLGWKNPDVGIDDEGNIVLKDRLTGQTLETNAHFDWFKGE